MKQSNKPNIQELIENLQTSQSLAEEVLTLLLDENKSITAMEIQTLARMSRQKEELLAKIHYMDKRVSETIGDFMKSSTSQDQKLTKVSSTTAPKLSDLAAILPEAQGATVLQYHKNLKDYREKIQTRNLINKRFISDTLLCINDAIALFTDRPEKNRTYGLRGVTKNANQKPAMISREV